MARQISSQPLCMRDEMEDIPKLTDTNFLVPDRTLYYFSESKLDNRLNWMVT